VIENSTTFCSLQTRFPYDIYYASSVVYINNINIKREKVFERFFSFKHETSDKNLKVGTFSYHLLHQLK